MLDGSSTGAEDLAVRSTVATCAHRLAKHQPAPVAGVPLGDGAILFLPCFCQRSDEPLRLSRRESW